MLIDDYTTYVDGLRPGSKTCDPFRTPDPLSEANFNDGYPLASLAGLLLSFSALDLSAYIIL